MAKKQVFNLTLNGAEVQAFSTTDATLLDLLRDDLSLRAAKRGCNQGVCGACTVMIDDLPVRACLTMAGACEGRKITTLEGYSEDLVMQKLQDAMLSSGGVQCGFCTGGLLVTARNLLQESPRPDGDEIRKALSGNLCRCTGYVRIIEAVAQAAEELAR